MKVAIASDQNGDVLRRAIEEHLAGRGGSDVHCLHLGPADGSEVLGPEVAERVALAVLSGEADRGILVCGTGVGMAIAVNKVPGIRGVLCSDVQTAEHSRRSSDTQVLVIGSRIVDPGRALAIVDGWLAAEYEDNPRRRQRLRSLGQLERRYARRRRSAPGGATPAKPPGYDPAHGSGQAG